MLNDVFVLIPSLNPDARLKQTIDGLKDIGFTRFIIVDDGSDIEHQPNFPCSDLENDFIVLRHSYNRGKGAAMKTGFKYLLKNDYKCKGVIAVDGDGQHHPEDVKNCALALIENNDAVILGCRNFSLDNVPSRSRFGNKTTSFVFSALCGLKISDTQTGLRAFPYSVLPFLNTIKGDRFEYETNMLLKFKQQGIEIKEVEIKTLYFEENSGSHFKVIRDSLRVYGFILTYLLSSVASCIIDLSFFYIICKFFGKLFGGSTVLLATVFARAISSLTNFFINKKYVFDSKDKAKDTIWRYYALAIPQMLISALLVWFLTLLLSTNPELKTVIKLIIDTILFFISYRIQQCWVFKKTEKKDKVKIKLRPKQIVLRSLLSVGTALVLIIITLFSTCLVLARGPSVTMRDMLVLSAKQASATKWMPGLFLPKETVEQILKDSTKLNTDTIDADSYVADTDDDEWADAIDGIKLIFLNKPKFKAYLLMVKDPKKVKVGVSSSNFKSATQGMRIFDMANKYNVTALINGGEFADIGGRGNGATPIGLTYSFGKKVWNDGVKRSFFGFDKNDKLICRESMTEKEAEELGIRDAVSFQNGNVLIDNIDGKINLYYSDNNTGTAQRTAIAQRKDGTVLMLVTDGRSASSIGATKNDVIDILVEYGAVSAGMLDGGSSAMMYYKNYYDIFDIDKSELDVYQKQGLVNRYKAFTKPRRIPTYFIVTKD